MSLSMEAVKMRKKKFFTTIMAFIALFAAIKGAPRANPFYAKVNNQERTKVESLISKGMPVSVDKVNLERVVNLLKLNYSVTNSDDNRVIELHWRLFIFDATGTLLKTMEWQDQEILRSHSTQRFSYNLDSISSSDKLVLTLSKVVGEFGKWEVSPTSKIDDAAKAEAIGQFNYLAAEYESNVELSSEDKLQLYKQSIEYILRRKDMPKFLLIKDSKNIILSSENIETNVPLDIPGITIIGLSATDIQKKAQQEGEIMYIRFQPFEVKGSQVSVELNYLRAVKAKTVFEPCCGGVLLEYVKSSGTWKLNNASSYKL